LSRVALLLIQAAAPAAAPPKVAIEPPKLSVAKPCPPQANGEIVVCGRTGQPSPYRLPLGPPPPEQPRSVRFKLPGDVAGNVHLEQRMSPDGIPDHRIMVHLTKKF